MRWRDWTEGELSLFNEVTPWTSSTWVIQSGMTSPLRRPSKIRGADLWWRSRRTSFKLVREGGSRPAKTESWVPTVKEPKKKRPYLAVRRAEATLAGWELPSLSSHDGFAHYSRTRLASLGGTKGSYFQLADRPRCIFWRNVCRLWCPTFVGGWYDLLCPMRLHSELYSQKNSLTHHQIAVERKRD